MTLQTYIIKRRYSMDKMKNNERLRTKDGVHIYTRCAKQQPLMKSQKAKTMLLMIMSDAQKKYDFKLHSYVIMDNHYHLFLTPKVDLLLPKIMKYINYRLSRWLNRFHNTAGASFQSRYQKKFIVEAEDPENYSNWLTVYHAMNPCRKGIVNNPVDYLFSSFKAYLDKEYKSPIQITFNDHYLELGFNFQSRRKVLLELIAKYQNMMYAF